VTRTRTPARGLPVWDDDLTPPPQEMPLAPMDDVPAPIRQQLALLADGVQDAKLYAYQTRIASHRLDQVDAKLGAIATTLTRHQTILDEHLVPQLDRWRAVTDGIAKDLPSILDKLEGVVDTLERFDRRLRDLEVEIKLNVQKLAASQDALAVRMAAAEAKSIDLALRVVQLETREVGRDAVDQALTKGQRNQVLKLTTGGGGLVGVVLWIINHFAR
jgi:hypothetical protein